MKNWNKRVWKTGLLSVLVLSVAWSGRPAEWNVKRLNPFAPTELTVVDSIMNYLSDDDRLAQLFIVKTPEILTGNAGGFLFDHKEDIPQDIDWPEKPLEHYVGVDLRASPDFLMSERILGRASDSAVMNYAFSTANDLRAIGVNYVLGPSLDIAYQSTNQIAQSFGDNPAQVASAAQAFITGFNQGGLTCIPGSFPGLGNAESAPLLSAPRVLSKKNQLYNSDFIPFKILINDGLQHTLIGSVDVPAIDSGQHYLASASPNIHAKLKQSLGYNGLIWADLSYTGANAVQHFLAGNDLMIVANDFKMQFLEMKEAINAGIISKSEIDARCRRIIRAKLSSKLNKPKSEVRNKAYLTRRAVQESLVLLRNQNDIIPLKNLENLSIGLVKIAEASKSDSLTWYANRYAPTFVAQFEHANLESDYTTFTKSQAALNTLIIIADEESGLPRKRFGMSLHVQSVVERLAYDQPTVLVWTGNPKALAHISTTPNLQAIVAGHRESPLVDDFTLQAIFGGRPFTGTLKRSLTDEFDRSFGIKTSKTRLAYGVPEEVGIESRYLTAIDTIMQNAIEKKATPGAQVWFAKDGVVVVNESFGHHRYDGERAVKVDDLYDLASITKIAGTVAALLKLSQDSLFSLDHNLCDYLEEWVDTTAYQNLGVREILAHQAGLPAFIPFYLETVKNGVPRFDVYSLVQNETYPYRVARELYINKDQPNRMFKQILNNPIKPDKQYKYSDVGYYFMHRIIEKQSGMPMDQYLDSIYYKPLGMTTMTYRPLEKFNKTRIAPTEHDQYFRHQLIQGDVHDPGAAMLGGVAGHAGLFSNAADLGKLMQLYLNNGEYGGTRFFDSAIIADFTRCQFCDNDNRRGAGFDKPVTDRSPGPTCGCTSLEAFGHQGFTGTCTWADPEKNVVYVFLSNRIYPNADNRKLAQMNVRTDIQSVFYKALELSNKNVSNSNPN